VLAFATRAMSASPLCAVAWRAWERPIIACCTSGRRNAAAPTSGVGVPVCTPTSASSIPVPSGVVPGSVVDTVIAPHSGWSKPGCPQPRGSPSRLESVTSGGWLPSGPVSSRSASAGAASTAGEVAIGGVGTASSFAVAGFARSSATDIVDCGTQTSGGVGAPGNGTGCSACWAWSWLSVSTVTWTQRPATVRCWFV
jgi:hypothetical protein